MRTAALSLAVRTSRIWLSFFFRQLLLHLLVDILKAQLLWRFHLFRPDDMVAVNRFDNQAQPTGLQLKYLFFKSRI